MHTPGWLNPNEYKMCEDDAHHETLGFLMRETEYSYSIAQSKAIDDAMVDSIMEIPKVSVIKVTELNA